MAPKQRRREGCKPHATARADPAAAKSQRRPEDPRAPAGFPQGCASGHAPSSAPQGRWTLPVSLSRHGVPGPQAHTHLLPDEPRLGKRPGCPALQPLHKRGSPCTEDHDCPETRLLKLHGTGRCPDPVATHFLRFPSPRRSSEETVVVGLTCIQNCHLPNVIDPQKTHFKEKLLK